jgi:hypothetical protein
LTIWEKERELLFPNKTFGELELGDLGKLTSLHTITRVRRNIQHDDNKYPPTSKEIIKKRSKNEEEMRDWIRRGS